jgi:hypothetical protein
VGYEVGLPTIETHIAGFPGFSPVVCPHVTNSVMGTRELFDQPIWSNVRRRQGGIPERIVVGPNPVWSHHCGKTCAAI